MLLVFLLHRGANCLTRSPQVALGQGGTRYLSTNPLDPKPKLTDALGLQKIRFLGERKYVTLKYMTKQQ